MNDLAIILLGFGMLAIILLSLWWTTAKSQRLIQQWAAKNEYQLVASEERYVRRGPFLWTTSRGQTVFHITVLDPAGRRYSGFVRCGSWFGGLFSDKVEVIWDEQSQP